MQVDCGVVEAGVAGIDSLSGRLSSTSEVISSVLTLELVDFKFESNMLPGEHGRVVLVFLGYRRSSGTGYRGSSGTSEYPARTLMRLLRSLTIMNGNLM